MTRKQLEEICERAADRRDVETLDDWREALFWVKGMHRFEARERENERWYRRAAEAGSTKGMVRLGETLDRLERSGEATPWFVRGAERGSADALAALARHHEQGGRAQEAERCWRAAIDAGSLDAMVSLARLVERDGRIGEAETWFVCALQDGSSQAESIMLWLAAMLEEQGRIAEAEQWLRTAVCERFESAAIPLANFLERHDRVDEAERSLRDAIESGHDFAHRALGDVLARQGRTAEAAVCYDDVLAVENQGTPLSAGVGTIVMTATITAAVVPFIQTLATKAAEDSYAAARAIIRRLLRVQGARKRSFRVNGPVVYVEDPEHGIVLHLRANETDEALHALAELNLDLARVSTDERGPLRVAFNDRRGEWELTHPRDPHARPQSPRNAPNPLSLNDDDCDE